jgi:hypothetical protein
MKKDFYEFMPLTINLALYLECYYDYEPVKSMKIQIIIQLLYLICWGYILIVSLPTFTISLRELVYIKDFQDFIDPFSQLKL